MTTLIVQASQLQFVAQILELLGLLPGRWLSRSIAGEVARLRPFLNTPAGQEQLVLYLERVAVLLRAAATADGGGAPS